MRWFGPLLLALFLACPLAFAQEAPSPADESEDISESEETSTPAPEPSADELLGRQIQTVLSGLEGLQLEGVQSLNGIITLQGTARTVQIRQGAEAIAQKMPGVIYVQNNLKTTTETAPDKGLKSSVSDDAIAERLNSIFALIPTLNSIRAEVVSGVVKLRGEASDSDDVERAEKLARETPGVVFVDSRVLVRVEVVKRVAPAWQKTIDLGRGFVQHIPLIFIGLILLYLFHIVGRFVVPRIPLRNLRNKPLADEFARNGIRVLFILVGLSLTLEIWGISALVAAFVGTAGVMSIGIGFAFKDVIENYLGGVLLGMRQPFRRNDFVDIAGFRGKVLQLTSRETVLMTLDGNHLTIPNAMVFKSVLLNFSRNPLRRFEFTIGVSPEARFKEIIPLGLETLQSTDGVLEDPRPLVRITEVGDYTLTVAFFAWVNQKENDLGAVKSEAIRRVNQAYLAAGVDMPEPMRRITMITAPVESGVQAPATDEAPMIDTSVDHSLDDQIAADELDPI